MTTSVDLSIDELLLLQENQSSSSNFAFRHIKPIGAERKVGKVLSQMKSSDSSFTRIVHSIKMDLSPNDPKRNADDLCLFDYSDKLFPNSTDEHFNSITKSQLAHQTIKDFEYQSSRISSTIQPRIYSNPVQTGKTFSTLVVPQSSSSNRFVNPHSSQLCSRNSSMNLAHQTRSLLTPPFQCTTRERFQVNSIGRPILRSNNYNYHLLQIRR